MGQIEGVVRVWGATAAELLTACLAGASAVSIDTHLVLGPADRRGITVHYLQTRIDGVVVLAADGGTPSFSAPASWVIFQSTSCSKGIDYEVITIRRGDEPLLSITEGPDGDLQVTRAGVVVESSPQDWTAEGEPIPREKPTSFRELVEKWLPVIAAELGEGAGVLKPGCEPAPPSPESVPDGDVSEGGDDIPF